MLNIEKYLDCTYNFPALGTETKLEGGFEPGKK